MWKQIKGTKYEVNENGEVRNSETGHIKSTRLNRCGYPEVRLYIDGKCRNKLVHRYVAEAFIPNPHGYPSVNHIDENKLNNRADNLEWCDVKYNINYGTRTKRSSAGRGKRVSAYINGEKVAEYASISEAANATGAKQENITNVLRGRGKTAAGYEWRWTNGNINNARFKNLSEASAWYCT